MNILAFGADPQDLRSRVRHAAGLRPDQILRFTPSFRLFP
jgi:hypothetical protein